MDLIKNGWFSEINDEWPGEAFSLEVEKILYTGKSKYQDILIFKSKHHGKVLVLDGVIQCTDRDEFSYQEMIAFLPLNSHPCPKKVLVVGGGDGGVIREVSKHPAVESIVQCEIDEEVINVCKKHLPNMAKGYSSPKLTQYIGDGFEYMRQHENEFDVVITDSSDPVGPAEPLFKEPYYELLKKALKPDGLLCSQGSECMWLDLPLIKSVLEFSRRLFPVVSYGYTTIPTYPTGQIGFILCSKNKFTRFDNPVTVFTDEELEKMELRYYNVDVHKTAFTLPQFAKKALLC
ncbi:unnamed protein product [Porites evermanni]|uniref:PABS domain-containing protein n=1 Tax=Porites evermanni TaxID=104178 RepID=A0ABN8NB66_9CNID|nr:unnamed protein product [Porites evermanni]